MSCTRTRIGNMTLILGCFPLSQRFWKYFRSEFKWKGLFQFLLTGIFRITSGGGPLILVRIFRPKFAVPFLTNQFFVLIREFGKGIKNGNSCSYWLARFHKKMSFHFPRVFPLISEQSVWHNGKHPYTKKSSVLYKFHTPIIFNDQVESWGGGEGGLPYKKDWGARRKV